MDTRTGEIRPWTEVDAMPESERAHHAPIRRDLTRTERRRRRVGRNDPCPCGSGTKFKACCLGRAPGGY